MNNKQIRGGGGENINAIYFPGLGNDEKTDSDLINILKKQYENVYVYPTLPAELKDSPVIIAHSIGIIEATKAVREYKASKFICIDTSPNITSVLYKMPLPPDEKMKEIILNKINDAKQVDLSELSCNTILIRRKNNKVQELLDESDKIMINKYPILLKYVELPQEVTHYIWRNQNGLNVLMKYF